MKNQYIYWKCTWFIVHVWKGMWHPYQRTLEVSGAGSQLQRGYWNFIPTSWDFSKTHTAAAGQSCDPSSSASSFSLQVMTVSTFPTLVGTGIWPIPWDNHWLIEMQCKHMDSNSYKATRVHSSAVPLVGWQYPINHHSVNLHCFHLLQHSLSWSKTVSTLTLAYEYPSRYTV